MYRLSRKEREAAEKRRSHLETVERLKRQGFTDKTMQDWTFANDNGSCPQMKNAGSALPNVGQWIAPTLDPDELEKRIQELKTVQFWLEQNARLLSTTIQALEVQRMTLATLKTMNLPVADIAEAFKLKPAETTPAWPSSPPPPPAPVAASEPIDLGEVLKDSGLVLIETRAEAVKAFQPEAAAEPVEPARRRRTRVAQPIVEEPLVQVETGPR